MSVINCLVAFTCLTFACAPLASGWSLPGWVSTAGNAIGSWVDNTLLPQSTKGCPPTGFDSLQGFDVLDYISAPWYVQWQQPISYQPKDSLYCVRALYHNISSNPLDGLLVLNSARKGGVTGRPMGTSDSGWFKLTATLPDKSQPSKLRVGPELWGWEVPNLLRGDYWIVAAGNDTGATGSKPYTWAIISGGVPQVSSNGLCKTGSVWPLEADIQTNNIGLWFFTRETVASAAKINVMLQKAKDLGLDTSVLAPVTQVGCTYPDTPPPAPAPVPAPTPNANATAAPSPPPAAIVTIRLRRRWF